MKQKVKLCTTVLLIVSLLGGCAEHPDDTGISTSDSNAMTIAASYPQDRLVATMVSSAVPDSSAFVLVSEFAPSVEISLEMKKQAPCQVALFTYGIAHGLW